MTDFVPSWLGSRNDRMIKGDFLASSLLNNLMDGVLFAKMKKMWEPGNFGGKINLQNNAMR